MDNQQDQFGTPNAADAGRTSQNPAATASGASAASRKSAPNPTAQSTAATPDASSQTTANAGADRQGEGQQTNAQEGTLLDTALNSGKKWIEDSGVLDSVNQLPQSLKDLGNRAVARVGELSTTQKVVGGAILAAGLGWLALRKGKSSSDSASYNYGKQRDTGSYGRRSYGYQAPDASTSRKSASGAASRSDSGSPYGNSGSRYGGSGSSYGSGSGNGGGNGYNSSSSPSNTGIHSGSGRSETNTGASAFTDHGARSKDDGFRSIE